MHVHTHTQTHTHIIIHTDTGRAHFSLPQHLDHHLLCQEVGHHLLCLVVGHHLVPPGREGSGLLLWLVNIMLAYYDRWTLCIACSYHTLEFRIFFYFLNSNKRNVITSNW